MSEKQWHKMRLPTGNDPVGRVEVHENDHTPSWMRPGAANGNAFARFDMHNCADWLSITVSENYEGKLGQSCGKEVMMTLDGAAARALYQLMSMRFGGRLK